MTPLLPHLGLLQTANCFRIQHGLKILRLSTALGQAAAHWLSDQSGPLSSHRCASGLEIEQILGAKHVPWRFCYVHVFSGQAEAIAVLERWNQTAKSREDLIDPNLSEIGLAFAYRGQTPSWVVITVANTRPSWLPAGGKRETAPLP